jgi:hypothetical protein
MFLKITGLELCLSDHIFHTFLQSYQHTLVGLRVRFNAYQCRPLPIALP